MNLTPESPKVGDEIYYAIGDVHTYPQRYLAIKIGLDPRNVGSELWFAWDSGNGTLSTVSVGHFWKVKKDASY